MILVYRYRVKSLMTGKRMPCVLAVAGIPGLI